MRTLPTSRPEWPDKQQEQADVASSALGLEDLSLNFPLYHQDSYPRFLKSELYKKLLAEALVPQETKKR